MLDRFLARVELGYPDETSECALYRGDEPGDSLDDLKPVLTLETLTALRYAVPHVTVSEPLARTTMRIVNATRTHEAVALGVSPRAAMSWLRSAKARALLEGRSYVLPDDLKALAHPVLGHRIFLKNGGDARELLDQVLSETPVDV